MIRTKRFAGFWLLPPAPSELGKSSPLPAGSRSMVGDVAAKLLDLALQEPGSVRLDIVIFLGSAKERWNPNCLPISGDDQTAVEVWELGRELAAHGHRVRVFGDCAGMQGTFAGVEWLDHAQFVDLGCDVLLSVRAAAVDPSYDVRARLRILWTEARLADGLTPALDRRLDAYFCSGKSTAARFRAACPYVSDQKILLLEPTLDGGSPAVAHELEKRFGALLYGKRLDVVVFTGPHVEPWNPDTLRANGMGGSETMAWELARRLVALGHRVRVFAHCRGLEGSFDGVEWLDYRRFRGLSCDVLLASRQPAAVDSAHQVQAKIRLLWVHEAHCGDKLTAARDARIDAYLCLSAWHVAYFRAHYPHLDARKILRVRNGIDAEDYSPRTDETRDSSRVVYSSCPSRGLKIALDAWPRIRAEVPFATLHVFYGFENWERSAQLTADSGALAEIASLKQQIADTDGVVFHGRTSPAELARHFRTAGVWAYPNWVSETSCITAMQAQAAGLRIVTSALAALNETVGSRGLLLTEAPHSDAYREAFAAGVIAALRTPTSDEERAALHRYVARHFDLERLAHQFAALFQALIDTRPAGSQR